MGLVMFWYFPVILVYKLAELVVTFGSSPELDNAAIVVLPKLEPTKRAKPLGWELHWEPQVKFLFVAVEAKHTLEDCQSYLIASTASGVSSKLTAAAQRSLPSHLIGIVPLTNADWGLKA